MKQAHTPTTTKVHYKLYKAGKFWLVGTLATVSLVAGLAVTNSAQADTTTADSSSSTDSSVESGSRSTDSKSVVLPKSTDSSTTKSTTEDTKTSDADETTTPATSKGTDPSDNGTSEPASNNSETTNSNNSTEKSETESSTNSTATSTSSVQSTTQSLNISKVNNVPADSTTNVNNLKIPAQTGKSSAVLASSGLTVKKSVDSLMKLRLAPASFKHATVTPVMESASTNSITTDSAFTLGPLSNFYLNIEGKYLPYNAVASANLYPYDTEHWKAGQKLFNFYIVLPESITSTQADMQAGATNYVNDLKEDEGGYIQIDSLTVTRLADANGRQIYCFQPDANAIAKKAGDTRSTSGLTGGQPSLRVKLQTTNDRTYKSIIANNSTGQAAASNDVIFAGIGNSRSAYSTEEDYTVYPSSDIGNDLKDAYVVGITNSSYVKTLQYTTVNVTDHFVVYNSNPNPTDPSTKYGTTYGAPLPIATGATGITYNPQELTSTTTDKTAGSATYFAPSYSMNPADIKSSRINKTLYWLPTLKYMGTSDNIDENAAIPTSVTLEPKSLDLSGNTSNGNTFVFYIDPIKTQLKVSPNETLSAVKGTWDPLTHLAFTSPSGLKDYASSLAAKEGILTVSITYTAPENDPVTVTSVDTSKPGTYVVTYSYKDAQGNVTGTDDAPISTTLTITNSASISTSSKPAELVVGQDWNPNTAASLKDIDGQPLVSLTDTDGQPVTPSASNLQVTSVKKLDEDLGTTVNTDVPGTYTVTYTYTDSARIGHQAIATVKVTSKSQLTAQDMRTTVGVKWSPAEAITSLTAANGTPVTPTDSDITVTNEDNSPVDTSKPGTYTVIYHYTDPTTKLDVASAPVTLTITPAPTTGDSGTNTGATTPDNGEMPITPTTPVKPTNPAKTPKPAKTVRPVKPVTVKGVAIKDPPIRAIGEPQYTPGIQTGVTVNNAPLSGGEAAAALENQNGRANPATVLTQAQADQLAAERTAEREAAARNATANHANQQNQQNQLADGTNASTTLPQTNDQPATWTAQLGVLLLGLASALGFRRKRN